MTCPFCDHEIVAHHLKGLHLLADHVMDAHSDWVLGFPEYNCACGTKVSGNYRYLVYHWNQHGVKDYPTLLCHMVLD